MIHQADGRVRFEHTELARRLGTSDAAAATCTGGTHPFEANKPLVWSLRLPVDVHAFWRGGLEAPPVVALAHVAKASCFIDGEASVSRQSPRGAFPLRAWGSRRHCGHPLRLPMQHVVGVASGRLLQSRRGVRLCSAFRGGRCTGASMCNKCPRDPRLVHLRSRWLSVLHGADACDLTASRGQAHCRKGRGKGMTDKRGPLYRLPVDGVADTRRPAAPRVATASLPPVVAPPSAAEVAVVSVRFCGLPKVKLLYAFPGPQDRADWFIQAATQAEGLRGLPVEVAYVDMINGSH